MNSSSSRNSLNAPKPTSTPMGARRPYQHPSITEDLSSISDGEPNIDEMIEETVTTSSSGSESSLLELFDDFAKFLQLHNSGEVFKWIKANFPAVREESIYGKFVKDVAKGEVLAYSVLNRYNKDNREQIITDILQFCLDITNIQHFVVEGHFDFSQNNLEKSAQNFLAMIEDNEEELIPQHYPFEKLNNQNVHMKIGAYHFIDKLIAVSIAKNIFQDDVFFDAIFEFLRFMSVSEYRCIKYTGVVFIAIIHSALMNYSLNYKTNIFSSHELLLFVTFMKHHNINDRKLNALRYDCLRALAKWMIYMPNLFLKEHNCLKYLTAFMDDEDAIVRECALKECQNFFKQEALVPFILARFDLLLIPVIRRFRDLENAVVLAALKLFAYMISVCPTKCEKGFGHLIGTMFKNNEEIAFYGAQCVLKLFHMKANTKKEVLLAIALITKHEFKYGLVVDCFLHVFDEMTNWNLYIDILINSATVNVALMNLSRIFYEAVHQVLVGKPSIKLSNNRNMLKEVEPSSNRKFSMIFIPKMRQVLDKFKDNELIFVNIVKIFNIINHEEFRDHFDMAYADIYKFLRDTFTIENNSNILQEIVKVFHTFNANIRNISVEMVQLAFNLCNNIGKSSHLTFLFRYFNLIRIPVNAEIQTRDTTYSFEYRKWFIVWSLRTFRQEIADLDQSGTSIDLDATIEKFITLINDLFVKLNKETNPLIASEIFTLLYDMLILYHSEIREYSTTDDKLNGFFYEIECSSAEEEVLTKFLVSYVISNTSKIPLYDRRCLLLKVFGLYVTKSVHFSVISYIFQFYDSHFHLFSSIDDQISTMLNGLLPKMVYNTFKLIYTSILNRYQSFDQDLAEVKKLNLIATKFAKSPYFKPSPENCYTLVSYILLDVVEFAVKPEFLHLALYFLINLTENQASELYEYLALQLASIETVDPIFEQMQKTLEKKIKFTKDTSVLN